LLLDLFDAFGAGAVLRPSFRCDYGSNISIGEDSFINYDCVFLDCNRITIGREVQIAPRVHIYTATHPLDAATRRSKLEFALPVTIEDGAWLGGGVIVPASPSAKTQSSAQAASSPATFPAESSP
jgi:maltose O-acetyltransferase